MSFALRGPPGPRGQPGVVGPAGPAGLGAVAMVATPGVTPPTARDADLIVPLAVHLGQQASFEIQIRCRNNTAASWRFETYYVTLSVTLAGVTQIDDYRIGSAVTSRNPYSWSGTARVLWTIYSSGSDYHVRVSCTGPGSVPLPAGCTWVGSAIPRHTMGGLI